MDVNERARHKRPAQGLQSPAAARIISAINFALRAYRAEALDVRLVHYKGVKGDFSGLEKEFGPKKKKGAKKKR